jgi:hypothetical protein
MIISDAPKRRTGYVTRLSDTLARNACNFGA